AFSATGCDTFTGSVEAAASSANEKVYRLDYLVKIDPDREGARVTLRLAQPRNLLREIRFAADSTHYSEISGDGSLTISEDQISWIPPATGGSLTWFVKIRRNRGDTGFDAYIEPGWALFRGEDIIPRAATRTLKAARSDTYLRFELPTGWSVMTEYAKRDGGFLVSKPERRFASPGGWILAGQIGSRTEVIAGTRVNVAAPQGHDVRRMDMIAFLHWTLPEVLRLLPEFPQRLTVFSAGDPMWRGGLSAEQSFFIHSERPLISENGTSALLHEVMHVGLGIAAQPGHDWIVEGLAEYYSIEILRRSGSVSETRHKRTMRKLSQWSKSAESLRVSNAGGAVTALAVTVFAGLDQEIRLKSEGRYSIDDVARALAAAGQRVSYEQLDSLVTSLIGEPAAALRPDNLRGVR
ncbi:MAG: hypothetical protein ACO2ZJ_09655, partial [Pseudohongiellaceae bacterium]